MANYTVNYAPSDINGAVGTTQYVQWVNVLFLWIAHRDASVRKIRENAQIGAAA